MLGEVAEYPREIAEGENARAAVLDSLRKFGLETQALHSKIIDHLILLERGSKFNQDSRMIETALSNLLNSGVDFSVSDREGSEIRLAALLHDVGKSGPARADKESQNAVVKLFAAENLKNPELPVEDALMGLYDGQTADEMMESLQKCGIEPQMPIRDFWNMHGQWTFDILEKFPPGISENTRMIAASHHIDRGINPCGLDTTNLESVPLAVKMLIAADKAQAAYRRSSQEPSEAVKSARKMLQPTFGHDKGMQTILNNLESLAAKGDLFREDLREIPEAVQEVA